MIDFDTHPWLSGLLGDEEIGEVFSPEAEIRRYLRIEAAWTLALGEIQGESTAKRLAKSIESFELEPSSLRSGFAKDGVPIPSLVSFLKAHLGEGADRLVHDGLTSQDVLDTGLMLALLEVLDVLEVRLQTLDSQLSSLQDAYGSAPLIAFTRMQPALETSVCVLIDRWRQPLDRLLVDLRNVNQACCQIQWGGPIGTRDHQDAHLLGSAFAKHLGLQDPGAAWHTNRTAVIEFTNLLSRISVMTGKIGEDVALMAALGSEQITISGGGSSAMPHKNNPVKAEALICLADHISTLQSSIARAARPEAFRSGRAWMLEWLTISQLCSATGAGLNQAKDLLDSIQSFGNR